MTRGIDLLVRGLILPLTGAIPFLVTSGILLARLRGPCGSPARTW